MFSELGTFGMQLYWLNKPSLISPDVNYYVYIVFRNNVGRQTIYSMRGGAMTASKLPCTMCEL